MSCELWGQIVFSDRENSQAQIGTLTDLAGRAIFLPAYLVGAGWVRTVIWNVATAGLAAVLVGGLFP